MPTLLTDFQTGVTRIEFELDEKELCAIGRVTAHWAYLEHGIYAVTKGISDAVGGPLPTDALNSSFKRRLKALRLLVEECAPADEKKRMLGLIGKIANAEQDRHKITHAMWDWDKSNSNKIKASSFRPGYEFEKQFDADKMHRLADTIGEISFALEYPDGMEVAFEEIMAQHSDVDGNVSFVGTSRWLHRELSSRRVQNQPESEPAKPQEDTRPLSSWRK